MPQIFGVVEQSYQRNGKQHTVFRIPAVSQTVAKQRAKINARLKSLSGASVASIQSAGKSSIPGFTLYDVDVTSNP